MRSGALLSTLAVVLPLAVWASGTAGAPSTRPATAAAPKSPGRWYCWSDCRTAHTVGFGKDSLWFGGSGLLWRYDVKKQTIRTFTPMDGLPLERWHVVIQIAVADDDKSCAIRLSEGFAGYLWQAKKGWRRLPSPAPGRQVGPLAFDSDGRLDCLVRGAFGTTAIYRYRWADGDWQKVLDVPAFQGFMPLKGGYFLYFKWRGGLAFQPGNGQKPVAYEIPKGLKFEGPVFRTGGRTLGLFSAHRGGTTVSVFCRITPEKIVEESEGVGFDLTGNGYLKRVGPEIRRGRRVHGIGSTTDDKVAEVRSGAFFFRDANGHIWTAPFRWDGRQWKLIVPKQHLELHSHVMDRRMFAFDESKMTWRLINQNVAPVLRNTYDSVTRTAWWSSRVEGRETYQHVRITGPKTEVLRTLPSPGGMGGKPQFKDPSGNWWGAGKGWQGAPAPFFVCRYDKAGKVHVYPCKRGAAGGHLPQIQLSPRGKVWLWVAGPFLRYDPKQDKFVRAEPWDDFSFRFGPWELSIAGTISSTTGQNVYRKVGRNWEPLKSPFGEGTARGTRGMIFRDRMLISAARIGVLEYDVTKDRWAVLSECSAFRAHFDEKGRRVLVNRRCVLLFDGDPFAPVDAKDKDTAVLSELLKLMDDASWRVREKATQELKKLYPTVRGRLQAALGRKDLSLEVRLRIQEILREMKADDSIPLVSLFRRMHPLVE